MTPIDLRSIKITVKKEPVNSVKDLHKTVPTKVGYRTLLKTASQLDIKRKKKYKMHLITEVQAKERVRLCKEHKNTYWSSCLFSDESYIEVAENGTQLMMRGEPIMKWEVQQKDKFPDKILIWGLIHAQGGGRVIVSNGNVNKAQYVQIVKMGVKSFVDQNMMQDWVFMHDDASAHTAEIGTGYLDAAEIDYTDWPVSSPDLNPIKYIWKMLKDHLGAKEIPKDPAEL